MVARGGRGGLGNTHFKTPPITRRSTPRRASGRGAGSARTADRRRRPRRAAQRRQVHAARGGDRRHAQDRRLPVHDARANLGVLDLGDDRRAPPDDRRPARPDRGRQHRRRARPRVSAPRRADPRPGPRRRRVVARPGTGLRGDPRGAPGTRSGAARQADPRGRQQGRHPGPPTRRGRVQPSTPAEGVDASRSRPRGDGLDVFRQRSLRSCPKRASSPSQPNLRASSSIASRR